METKRLHQFKVIVDVGGLVRAGELLGISGGGLSKSIQSLENELGFELFVQRGRGLELTTEGKRLYERIPDVLKTIDDLLRFKDTAAVGKSPFKIVSFEVFTTYFLGSTIARSFRDRAIDVREAIPGEMEALVADGSSDIGITYMPIPHADVEFQKITRVKMGVFGLKDSFKGKAPADIPFVVPVAPIKGTPSGVQGLDGWPEHLFSRHILYRVEMMETALQICRRGSAVAFLPDFVVKLANQQASEDFKLGSIQFRGEIKPVVRDVYLIQRKGFKESREVRDLAKALRGLE